MGLPVHQIEEHRRCCGGSKQVNFLYSVFPDLTGFEVNHGLLTVSDSVSTLGKKWIWYLVVSI